MATRTPPNRPWRAIISLVLALAAVVAAHVAGVPLRVGSANTLVAADVGHLITLCTSAAFIVLATISTFAFATWARDVLERFIGAAYSAIVRYAMIMIGLGVVIVVTLSLLGFRVAQLVVGGAVTGVLITIAAQQSLSNLFAGVMLQFAQPFRVGERVQIRSGAMGGTIDGTVVEFGITYVRLETDEGRMLLPNSQVLAAAVIPMHHRAVDAESNSARQPDINQPGYNQPDPGQPDIG